MDSISLPLRDWVPVLLAVVGAMVRRMSRAATRAAPALYAIATAAVPQAQDQVHMAGSRHRVARDPAHVRPFDGLRREEAGEPLGVATSRTRSKAWPAVWLRLVKTGSRSPKGAWLRRP